MIIDAYTRFSNAQAITSNAGSTNVVDLNAVRDIAVGQPLYVVCQVTTAFTDSSSNSTVTVTVEDDNNSGFSSAATALQTIGVFAALSAVGTQLIVPLQLGVITQRFIRLKYTLANGNLSAGAVSAFLTPDPQKWQAYAKGYSGPDFS